MMLIHGCPVSMTRFFHRDGPGDIPMGPEVTCKTKQKLCHYSNYLKKQDKNEYSDLWTGISSSLFRVVADCFRRRKAVENI
jgi:hypothetical protein